MAALPRAQVSVSSELNSMARMRAHTRELSAKDHEWQLRLEEHLTRTAPPPLSLAPPVATSIAPPTHYRASPRARPQQQPPTLRTPPPTPPLCASPVSPADGGPPLSPRKPRSRRGAGKIRRKRLTKEEEARFPAAELADLTGTTAARSRKMSSSERDLMLHKRRLRNRESAARSRDKQRRTAAELCGEVDALMQRTRQLFAECERAAASARMHEARAATLADANAALAAELSAMRAACAPPPLPPPPRAPSSSRVGSLARSGPLSSADSLVERLLGTDPTLPSISRATSLIRLGIPGVSSWANLAGRSSSDRLPDLAMRTSSERLPDLAMRSSDRFHEHSGVLRKGPSAIGLIDLELPKFDAPGLSQDMAAMMPTSNGAL